jgi:uncharacterized beta-barrel protein YwiB (DUF1934 family)
MLKKILRKNCKKKKIKFEISNDFYKKYNYIIFNENEFLN